MIRKLIAVALFAALFGVLACDRFVIQDTKKQRTSDVAEMIPVQPPQSFMEELEKMKDDIANLNAILSERESQLISLQASLASKDASVINMTTELAAYKKNIKIVAVMFAVSLVLNLILVWVLLRNCKKPGRLALPAAENKNKETSAEKKITPDTPKGTPKQNSDAQPKTDSTVKPEKKLPTPTAEKQTSPENVAPDKPKRGRKPKNPENK